MDSSSSLPPNLPGAGTPTVTVEKKKGGCLKVGLLIFAGLMILLVALVALMMYLGGSLEQERQAALDRFFGQLKEGNFPKAYAEMADPYRGTHSLEEFQSFVEEKRLTQYADAEWQMGENTTEGERIYKGELSLKDQSHIPFYVTFSSQNNAEIFALSAEKPQTKAEARKTAKAEESPPAKKEKSDSGIPDKITDEDGTIKIGFSFSSASLKNVRLTADKSPETKEQAEFPDDVKGIYCHGAVRFVPSETSITGKWFYSGEKGDEPPKELVSSNLKLQSDRPFHFEITRGGPFFPTGHYTLALYLDGKKKLEKPFLIRIPSVEELTAAANKGSLTASYRLYKTHDFAPGAEAGNPLSAEEVMQWLRKSAEGGLPAAQSALGDHYYRGYIVEQDFTQAVQWFRKAAEQGALWAQYHLAICYREGQGVTKDLTEAVVWTRKAAEQGDADAQYNLYLHYREGVGIGQNSQEAMRWLQAAVKQDSPKACFALGGHYEQGELGVEKNLPQAIDLYKKAAAGGMEQARAALLRLGVRMPPPATNEKVIEPSE